MRLAPRLIGIIVGLLVALGGAVSSAVEAECVGNVTSSSVGDIGFLKHTHLGVDTGSIVHVECVGCTSHAAPGQGCCSFAVLSETLVVFEADRRAARFSSSAVIPDGLGPLTIDPPPRA